MYFLPFLFGDFVVVFVFSCVQNFYATHLHFIYVCKIPSIRCLVALGSSFFFCHIFFAYVFLVWFGFVSVAFHLHRVTVSLFRIYSICYARCAAYSSDYIKINGYQKLCVLLGSV